MKTLPFRYEVMDGKGEPMFLVLNFEIVDERELYGGKRRYILRKEF